MVFCPVSLTAGKKACGVNVACDVGCAGEAGTVVAGGAAALHAVNAMPMKPARKSLINTTRL
jgi:hypothetical protein